MICDARLIYGRGWISRVFICCAPLRSIVSDVARVKVRLRGHMDETILPTFENMMVRPTLKYII